jgi:1-acyl-sn-glycerol-3-phosphate acyltransferase
MYEENLTPLADGDFAEVFADLLARIGHVCQATSPTEITPRNVVQWARPEVQPYLARICRRLLLPGSAVVGAERLAELTRRALQGRSCIVCLNHRSNLDVPNLYALLEDRKSPDLFHRIIWIAGRKLQEDVGATRMLVQGINRVIVTPRSWMSREHSDDEWHEAHQINIAAQRAIHELRYQGWVFAIFPTATRVRPNDESTTRAIEEIDSYLKHFEFMLLGRIDGCTLPVSRDHNLTHETPRLDRVRYSFGAIRRTDQWRASVAEQYPELDQRAASARAIIEDITSLDSNERDDL